jgi:uncharacterized MAPEG superfamily protein
MITIALWCVLLAAVMPVMTVALAKFGTTIDNNHPRDWAEKSLDGYRKRAYAAHQNGYEAFPFFATSVLVSHLLQVSPSQINALAVSFIIARVAYVGCYITDQSTLRSLAWFVAWVICIALFVSGLL